MTSGAPLPQPTASGTLAKTPFPHLLLYLMEKQLTGSVELIAPDGERASILVLEGFPSKVRTSESSGNLGIVLLESGLIRDDELQASMQYYRPGGGQLHGQVLISLGIIDKPRLLEGLRRQLMHKLEYLFNWPADTQYAYYDGFDLLSDYGADDMVTTDPMPLVWASIKQAPSWEHAHTALSRVGGASLRIAANAQLERLGLSADERQFVELMRARPRRLYEMTSAGTLGPSTKQLLVYCLVIAKQLEVVADDASAPGAPVRRSGVPAPPVPSTPATVARVQLQPRQVPKPPAVGAVEEQAAPSVRRRDQRSSSPLLTPAAPVPVADIGAAIAEATRGLDSGAPPPPLPGTVTAPAPGTTPSAPPSRPSGSSIPAAPASYPSGALPAAPPSSNRDVNDAAPLSGRGGGPSSSRQPVSLSTELANQKKKILQRAEEITRQDYFQMLGISREATTDEVQKAYFLLAKVWHPDRLPPPLRDVREQCTKVFAHLSEAHQTLTDAERRGHYMTLIKDGGATPDDQAEIMGVLEAATNFQKAEICLKRNDLPQAEQLVRLAHKADPKQADYLALLAWLEAMKPENQSNQATEAKIAMLDQALRLNGKCERALFYRGMLFKRTGNEKGAYKDFRDAIELNPRNIEATREVRLYTMRKEKSSSPPTSGPTGRHGKKPDPSGGGLFGKLFKK